MQQPSLFWNLYIADFKYKLNVSIIWILKMALLATLKKCSEQSARSGKLSENETFSIRNARVKWY